MKEIYLYVEGGGGKDGKARLREAFSRFLGELTNEARRRGIIWRIVLCGSRTQTYEDFLLGMRTHPDAYNVLLVDAERPVIATTVREHLEAAPPEGDGWKLGVASEDRLHLMAQMMESWFIADPEALASVYGKGFAKGAIPKTRNVESIAKADVMDALSRATKGTQKGEYHKMRHSPQILERLDAARVEDRAPHCAVLLHELRVQLGLKVKHEA
ncbi:MAG TPA: DUF4276 family protein [Longimicrobium sp.]|nr:DUF4276 family protein [Longimicrobium sp.]